MNTDIQTELTQVLLSHEKVWANEEKTILAKNILLDLVEKTDPTIIGLLLGNDELKRHFFVEVNGVLVFKLQDFRFFLDKHSINNSYTKYANRIGLTDGNRFLKDSSDIVLDFPFKDCVLNGGQSTEEGEEIYFKRNNNQSDSQLYTKSTRKRQEVFFNQTLAFDEIDRLFDAKAFSKFSRHTADGKQLVDEIKRHSDGTPAENLIIKGNNLIALHALATQFKGKVKLIYIDVPFNTENDSFVYNDKFTHSTWLTFMKNRLEIAKKLLSDDGIICVHTDNTEAAYVQVLLDEIFIRNNFLNHITITTNAASGFKATGQTIFSTSNHIFVYARNRVNSQLNKLYLPKQYDENYKYFLLNPDEHFSNWKFSTILEQLSIELKLSEKEMKSHITEQELLFKISEFADKNRDRVFRTAAISGGALKKRQKIINHSKNNKGIVFQHENEDVTGFYILNGEQMVFWENTYRNIDGNFIPATIITDVWTDISFTGIASEGGVKLKNGKKPEKLIKRIIELTTNENDIILDYHLGSGTTAAVAHKMNRQYIGIEQMDYIETLAVERLKKVIEGEQGGISKAVNWQGGGEFVYAELAPFNETAKQQILACENSDDIKTLFDELCERYFLKYNVSVNEFSQIIEEPKFQSLPLDEQKQMVLEMLDLNQMYVSLSEMDDEQFAGCLNDDDKALSRAFYQSVKNQAEKKDGE